MTDRPPNMPAAGPTDTPADRGGSGGDDTDAGATTTAGDRRAQDFVASLPEPPTRQGTADDPGRHNTYARLGFTVMVIGLVLAVVAVVMSQSTNNPLDQSTQISLGIAGVAAVVFGGVVFLRYSLGQLLRFWLLRMLHEQHGDHSR